MCEFGVLVAKRACEGTLKKPAETARERRKVNDGHQAQETLQHDFLEELINDCNVRICAVLPWKPRRFRLQLQNSYSFSLAVVWELSRAKLGLNFWPALLVSTLCLRSMNRAFSLFSDVEILASFEP